MMRVALPVQTQNAIPRSEEGIDASVKLINATGLAWTVTTWMLRGG